MIVRRDFQRSIRPFITHYDFGSPLPTKSARNLIANISVRLAKGQKFFDNHCGTGWCAADLWDCQPCCGLGTHPLGGSPTQTMTVSHSIGAYRNAMRQYMTSSAKSNSYMSGDSWG